MMTAHLHPSTLGGTMHVPPSKSMAHRMLICASLARGFSHVEHLDYSVDIEATIDAMRQLGALIRPEANQAEVEGVPGGFATITRPINCSESGSTLRFLIPLFSLTGQQITFTGAPRLFQRPLTVYETIFHSQGLAFGVSGQDLVIKGALRSGTFTVAGDVSSQFISGLLFALPLLEGDSRICITPPVESLSYIELTRNAQKLFGVTSEWENDTTLFIKGKQKYLAANCAVEGDWSQAAVPAVLGAVKGGISIAGLSPDSAQGDKVILSILEKCGAQVDWKNGLLEVMPPDGILHAAGDIDMADCPDLGPVLTALALFCEGNTKLINAQRLRIKESDRISSVESEFKKLGGRLFSTHDSLQISGSTALLSDKVAVSHNDHRVVMALSVAALCAGIPLTIEGAEAIRKSWPNFFNDLKQLGAEVTLNED